MDPGINGRMSLKFFFFRHGT